MNRIDPRTIVSKLIEAQSKTLDPIGQAIQKSMDAACIIRVDVPGPSGPWSGSGFLLPNGIIITASHLFPPEGPYDIAISFDGIDEIDAMLVNMDTEVDVAILAIDENTPVATVELSLETAIPGEIIAIIGAPEGWANTVTVGRVSAIGRTPSNLPDPSWQDMTFVDADIREGSSGSMVIDITGKVIGMAMGVIGRNAKSGMGQNAIVPSARIQKVLNEKTLSAV